MQRYGLVDVAEEVLDGINILQLHLERNKAANPKGMVLSQYTEFMMLLRDLERVIGSLQRLDALLPDEVCTDEQGGERVWWSRQSRMESGEPKRCPGCGRIISDDEAYDRCFPCRAQDERERGGGDE